MIDDRTIERCAIALYVAGFENSLAGLFASISKIKVADEKLRASWASLSPEKKAMFRAQAQAVIDAFLVGAPS